MRNWWYANILSILDSLEGAYLANEKVIGKLIMNEFFSSLKGGLGSSLHHNF